MDHLVKVFESKIFESWFNPFIRMNVAFKELNLINKQIKDKSVIIFKLFCVVINPFDL